MPKKRVDLQNGDTSTGAVVWQAFVMVAAALPPIQSEGKLLTRCGCGRRRRRRRGVAGFCARFGSPLRGPA